MYINKVQILGNLTRDPELKSLPSGIKVCSFSVATNEVYRDKKGIKQEKVEFHNVVCFGKTAENVAQYMKKGSQIYVEGKIQTRTWDDKTSGDKRYRTEVLGNHIQFGRKPAGTTDPDERDDGYGNGNPHVAQTQTAEELADELNPEDIPF